MRDTYETEFRVIDGEVYEVMYDSRSNPYLKRQGIVVDHETDERVPK